MVLSAQAPVEAPVRPWPALIAAYAGVFLTISDLFKVLVAVPSIERALHAPPAVGQLVLAGFQHTYAGMLVAEPPAGDQHVSVGEVECVQHELQIGRELVWTPVTQR